MATRLTKKEDIQRILDEMDIDEKLYLLAGRTVFSGGGNPKYGIPYPLFLDGGTGFNSEQMRMETVFKAIEERDGILNPDNFKTSLDGFLVTIDIDSKWKTPELFTEDEKKLYERSKEIADTIRPSDGIFGCYPSGMLLGATMNPEVVESCGEAVGREASACNIDVLLGTPNVNIHRDPRSGRLFEGYSEDPYLVSKLAPKFVSGVQSTGVVANVKHFAANNQETDRMGVNEIISERALQEIYFPGFKACVQAGCKTVMSDWGAVYHRKDALLAGNDVVMPGPREISSLKSALKNHEISEDMVDEACKNYLNVVLDMPVVKGRKYDKIDPEYSMKRAYEAVIEGVTLLKNNGILPFNLKSKVSFYGQRSKKFLEYGSGSAAVITTLSTNVFDSAAEIIGNEQVEFEKVNPDTSAIVVTVGVSGHEGADRTSMDICTDDKILLEKAISDGRNNDIPVVLILNIAAPVNITDYADSLDAIICIYIPGMAGGKAAADILFGKVNPSGKLPLSYPKRYADVPSSINFPGEYMEVNYGEGIYVGYRYYEKKGIEPLFPFGFGLSYTKFELTNLSAPEVIHLDKNDFELKVDIENIGEYAGSEVVQLYVSDLVSTLDKPIKELKEFQKIFLESSERKTISFTLKKSDFSSYDSRLKEFVTEPGEFNVMIGTSSQDIHFTHKVLVVCENPYGLNEKIEISKLMTNETALKILKTHLPQIDPIAVVGTNIVFSPTSSFKEVWGQQFLSGGKI